jgi:hypothetical protein
VPNVATLSPGQSASASVRFRNPANIALNFSPIAYSGSFN